VFTVSDTAANAIRELVANTDAPEGTGLRIATLPGADTLDVALAAEPQPGDTVYHAGEAHIFADEGAARVLNGQAIDVMTDDAGHVQFILGAQAP
jgi:Fe-S cluster assembly iron-binding protein IscA